MKTFVLFIVLWSTSACAATDLSAYEGLDKRFKEYYALEQRNDWAKAYYFRTPKYRRTVPLSNYVSSMRRDSAGWTLMEYHIIGSDQIDNEVQVKVLFVDEGPLDVPKELVPAGVPPQQLKKVTYRTIDTSVWTRIDNEWYLYEAGTRMHLTMNPALAPD